MLLKLPYVQIDKVMLKKYLNNVKTKLFVNNLLSNWEDIDILLMKMFFQMKTYNKLHQINY